MSGPNTASITTPTAVDTDLIDGSYVFELAASDGLLSASATITINIDPPASEQPTQTIRKHYSLAGVAVATRTITDYPTLTDTDELQWIVADHLGSTTNILSDTLQSEFKSWYYPYGATRGPATDGGIDQTYTGQTNDPGTGLIHYNARQYDPIVGRFIQQDSIVPDPSSTQDLNRYMYVRGNPMMYVDPSGHDLCPTGGNGCGGVKFGDYNGNGIVEPGVDQIGQAAVIAIAEGRAAARAPYSDGQQSGGEFFRQWIFDYEACTDDIGPACGVEIAFIMPWGRAFKAAGRGFKFVSKSDEAADLGRWVTRSPLARRLLGGNLDEMLEAAYDACRANSFVAGSMVLMADGTSKAIEDVEVGDYVYATDPESGESGARRVTDTILGSGLKDLVEVTVGDGAVTATDNHPFWVEEQDMWVAAGDLAEGDLLRLDDGETANVFSTREWRVDTRVYNLTVSEISTYYVLVGARSVLVHNCVRGTGGLDHSFDRHSAQWFGRKVGRDTHLEEWTKLVERASSSSIKVSWSVSGTPTVGRLARIEGKPFFVQHYAEGPLRGQLATAFVPNQKQIKDILAQAFGG